MQERVITSELDSDSKLKETISRINAYAEELRQLPVENYEIHNYKECPFERHYCEKCAEGVKAQYQYGDQVRKVYDVSECYKAFIYKQLLGKSRLKGIQLEQTFEAAAIDKFNKKLYMDLQQWDYKSGTGVYIAAQKEANNPQGNGTGKTYAMNALTHKLCKNGVSCLHVTTVEFFNEIKSTYGEDSRENEVRVLGKYINVPVLLWDDLGKESFNKNSEWAPEKIYHIVDERITRNKPIIISSNFSIEDLEVRFGEDNHGPAIVSRLFQHCKDNYYFLGGPDRRLQRGLHGGG